MQQRRIGNVGGSKEEEIGETFFPKFNTIGIEEKKDYQADPDYATATRSLAAPILSSAYQTDKGLIFSDTEEFEKENKTVEKDSYVRLGGFFEDFSRKRKFLLQGPRQEICGKKGSNHKYTQRFFIGKHFEPKSYSGSSETNDSIEI